jgi:hypothetical protein
MAPGILLHPHLEELREGLAGGLGRSLPWLSIFTYLARELLFSLAFFGKALLRDPDPFTGGILPGPEVIAPRNAAVLLFVFGDTARHFLFFAFCFSTSSAFSFSVIAATAESKTCRSASRSRPSCNFLK